MPCCRSVGQRKEKEHLGPHGWLSPRNTADSWQNISGKYFKTNRIPVSIMTRSPINFTVSTEL